MRLPRSTVLHIIIDNRNRQVGNNMNQSNGSNMSSNNQNSQTNSFSRQNTAARSLPVNSSQQDWQKDYYYLAQNDMYRPKSQLLSEKSASATIIKPPGGTIQRNNVNVPQSSMQGKANTTTLTVGTTPQSAIQLELARPNVSQDNNIRILRHSTPRVNF